VILDAGPLVAYGDARDPVFPVVDELLREEPGRLIVPAPVTAEVDHLLRARLGPEPARAFAEDIAAGRFEVICLDREEHQLAADLDRRYADLGLGLADLSIVLLAARFETRRVLTFDERDFRAVEPLQGGAFTLLPADR
jgi:uncharacterized protein